MPMHCMRCKEIIPKGHKTFKTGHKTVCSDCHNEIMMNDAEADEFERQIRKSYKRDPQGAYNAGL